MLRGLIAPLMALALLVNAANPAVARELTGTESSAVVQEMMQRLTAADTVVAGFTMLSEKGISNGTLFVDRERQAARMQFDPPVGHIIIVNGPLTRLYGGDGTIIETATAKTPLIFLIEPEKTVNDRIDVLQVDRMGDKLTIAVARRGEPDEGKVVLNFQEDSKWPLTGWGAFDAEGVFSTTMLRNIRTGVRIDSGKFVMPE